MGNFNRDYRPSGNRNFGRRDFNNRGGEREMHQAICSSCGKECEVPFRPNGSKPVYCSDCFEKQGGGFSSDRSREGYGPERNRMGEDRGPRRPRFKNSNFENRSNSQPQNNDQFNAMDAKLDKILSLLTPQEAPIAQVKPAAAEIEKKMVEKPTKTVRKIKAVPDSKDE